MVSSSQNCVKIRYLTLTREVVLRVKKLNKISHRNFLVFIDLISNSVKEGGGAE